MIRPRLFTIERTGPGRLSTMAAPAGGDALHDEMRALADAGIVMEVSLLTDAEDWELDLMDEEEAAATAGISLVRLPTPDRGVPGVGATHGVARRVLHELTLGHGVAIHCRAGIGRASLLAACVLSLEGMRPSDTWPLISAARGVEVPDTDGQRAWVEKFADQVSARSSTGSNLAGLPVHELRTAASIEDLLADERDR